MPAPAGSFPAGGSGADTLTGGSADDILIGGQLSYYIETTGFADTAS
jgi:Ca2+-binding RTX toxin-like protein